MSKRNNKLLLEDMLACGNKILSYTQEMTFDDFLNNEMVVDAVIRNFEIIGEASNRLTDEFKNQIQNVEWRDFTDFRNKLIHEYFGVNLYIIFDVIKLDLENLLSIVEEIIQQQSDLNQY